ncbi:SH3 domain-containing protein [Sphingomonas sp. RP10(2022)]|uniref:SH3 domain-containing protein n=1 Tax=Sphingomonas liriopis TaxID=2949094 RepID=A0A9X2KN45_9SPHN|nr:SH3 domain-containing protein [Sphingomonas liriopis]MCP3733284.1 SH3 domain-containing protein [Sphingomonas liriopis]
MAKANPTLASQPSRKAFALTGPSVTLDPRTHAVRGDLADVRLAERVFAPHYAAPLKAKALQAITLFTDRNLSEPLADLAMGDVFEVLELAGRHAWGRAIHADLVGYVDRTALDRVTDFDS